MNIDVKKIKSALISVYNKEKLDTIVKKLDSLNVSMYSTGGTLDFIESLEIKAESVETLTGYPSIFGGRVKTLHPKIFGGILARRDNIQDKWQLGQYEIPEFDLVIVDLYPFEETLASGAEHDEIIEKIDIGGISLIRAAAKNYNDILVVSSRDQYQNLIDLLNEKEGKSNLNERKQFANKAFAVTSKYDTSILNYFNNGEDTCNCPTGNLSLRYGENPHQKGSFVGNLDEVLTQIHGKEISYNNLLDIDASLALIADFNDPTYAILKHNNACGCASNNSLLQAWKDALAADPVSAFGGIIVTNGTVDETTAKEIDKIFFEIILAPSFTKEALEVLKTKKNRIILITKPYKRAVSQSRSLLNGTLIQDTDLIVETAADLKCATTKQASKTEIDDMLFANKLVKHSKSNAIVLVKNGVLLASGVGQTSRVDALKQAIDKAKSFGFSLEGAVMASDAFFPFPDCVEIAGKAGITAVIQPGGSVKDQDTVNYCNANGIAMVITGYRHFKH